MEKTSDKQVGHTGVADLVEEWGRDLEAADRSEHTVRAYAVAVRDFLLWYRDEEGRSPTLADLTPIALLGYRNELQHEQAKSTSTVNTRLAGLRSLPLRKRLHSEVRCGEACLLYYGGDAGAV